VKHQEGLDRWLGLEDLDEKSMGISLGKNVRLTFFSMTPEQKSWMKKNSLEWLLNMQNAQFLNNIEMWR
jgi:hypothetical protein